MYARGEKNPKAKLTVVEVLEIKKEFRESDISQADLAKKYGVTQSNISHIINGIRWTHLPGVWD